jgi:hypothetical protein
MAASKYSSKKLASIGGHRGSVKNLIKVYRKE